MASSLGSLIGYGSDEEAVEESKEHSKHIQVSTEEVYAEDGTETAMEEPNRKRRRLNDVGKEIDSAVDSFLAEIGDDLEKAVDDKANKEQSISRQSEYDEKNNEENDNSEAVENENIDGEEIPIESLPLIPTKFESAIEKTLEDSKPEEDQSLVQNSSIEENKSVAAEKKNEEPDVKLPYFKLANRCANAMKSTLNVRSVHMEEYGGFRVYLRYDDVPICLLSSMGQHESEITARRSAVKELVEQMLDLGLFPPNTKKILAEKITTVDKMIEVTKPVLSYLKFQLSDQKYQRMLRDDSRMSIKADCTRIQLELIAILIDQIKFFTYRFYAEPTNNPWLHLAPANSVAPSVYTSNNQMIMKEGEARNGRMTPSGSNYGGGVSSVKMDYEVNEEPVYGGDYGMEMATSFSTPSSSSSALPPLANGMKLRIIEDNTDSRPPGTFFSLPPTIPAVSTSGFQSQYVRTVSVMSTSIVKEEPLSAAIRINVPKHEVISEIVERTIGALGWTERNDTIMASLTRKRAYLWVDEVPIAILGSMGESEKLSEAVSSCTHELMEQLCAWSLFPLDMVSQICRNKDYLYTLLYSMSTAFSFISSLIREPQYMAHHMTQGMARVPHEAPASHQAVAISFRCQVKSFMDKFWESHKIQLGPLIPLPKLEQWERAYFLQDESVNEMVPPRETEESKVIVCEKSRISLPWAESEDAPEETEEYL